MTIRPVAGARTDEELKREVVDLLCDLVRIDTSNPPGRETLVARLLASYLEAAGVEVDLVARDPARANLVARVRGGSGPTLSYLGHSDVVHVNAKRWSVDPFGGVRRDGFVWGRGTVDMKCQVAAAAVALAELARSGERPGGDVLLVVAADEEQGEAGVGIDVLVEERPEIGAGFVVGEGAGEQIPLADGPLYLFSAGDKASTIAHARLRGVAGDASLPRSGASALTGLTPLLDRLQAHHPPKRVEPEIRELLEALAPAAGSDDELIARGRAAHPYLDRLLDGLVAPVYRPTIAIVDGPMNMVPDEAELVVQCLVLPGTAREEVERDLRAVLGRGPYELEVPDLNGGTRSPTDTPLRAALASALEAEAPGARLLPTLAYGYTDSSRLREELGAVAYGFIPFRAVDPEHNLDVKHGADERVHEDDLLFQTKVVLGTVRALHEEA